MVKNVPDISRDPDLAGERTYKIWGSENLADWVYSTNALHRFFKVTVEMK